MALHRATLAAENASVLSPRDPLMGFACSLPHNLAHLIHVGSDLH